MLVQLSPPPNAHQCWVILYLFSKVLGDPAVSLRLNPLYLMLPATVPIIIIINIIIIITIIIIIITMKIRSPAAMPLCFL